MKTNKVLIYIILTLLWMNTTAFSQNSILHITIPSENSRIVHVPGAVIKGMLTTSEKAQIQLLQKKNITENINVVGEELQADFPIKIRDMFNESLILTNINVVTTYFNKDKITDNFNFPLSEQVDLRKFWDKIEFRKILSHVYDINAIKSYVTLMGWSLDKRDVNMQDIKNSKTLFSFRIKLDPGNNSFYLRVVNDDYVEMINDTINYFYPSDLIDESPGKSFQSGVFHTIENENGCSDCHVELVRNNCEACHSSILDHKTIHPILEEEDCSVCHDPDSSPKHQLLGDMKNDPEYCLMCHGDIEEAINDVEFIHAPATEACIMCHDAHASSQETLTVIPVYDICAYCHEDMANTPHPVPTHPISGVPDPSRPGKEMNCTSCHNPHGSDHSSLLYQEGYGICKRCHKK